MTKQQSPLKVLVFADGKPGHENQSFGLLKAMEHYRSLEITAVKPLAHSDSIAAITIKKKPASLKKIDTPDLILGTGAGTQFSLLAAKKLFGSYTVVLSGPSFPETLFDLCVIPEHDGRANRDNVIFTQGVINKVTPSHQHNPDTGLILIGGHSKHYAWDSHEIANQLHQIVRQQPNIHWQATNSRRTPEAFNNQLKSLSANIQFHHWESTPKDWLPNEIAKAGQIWVTPDSVSMVYESLTSGGNVFLMTLPAENTRVSNSIEKLRLSLAGELNNGKITFSRNQSGLWESDRIAKIVLERLEKQ